MKKRYLSILVTVCLVLSLVPVLGIGASAAGAVSFDARNGTVTQATVGSVTLPADPVWRSGYSFAGWYTGIDGTGSRITSASDAALTAGATVYAKWLKGTALVRTRELNLSQTSVEYVDAAGAKASANPQSASISNSGEGWSWTYKAGGSTLTLSGAVVDSAANGAIEVPDGTAVVLADGTTTSLRSGDSDYSLALSAYTDTDHNVGMTIGGSGSLVAEAGKATGEGYYSVGIYAYGPIVINAGRISAVGGQSVFESGGIYSQADAVTVNGGTVSAAGGETASEGISAGIAAKADIALLGGTVSATGSAGSTYSFGIGTVSGNLRFAGGKLSAVGGTAAVASFGTANIELGKPTTLTPAGATAGAVGTAGEKSYYKTVLASDGKTVVKSLALDYSTGDDVSLPFTDVAKNNWAWSSVAYVYTHGLLTGTAATTFSPAETMTRAMLVTVLWRMEGSPVVNYAMNFPDVPEGKWYSEAVRWAASEKLVTGNGDGTFLPEASVTREQLAVILYRYAQHKGYDVSIGEETNILDYDDAFTVSEYAYPALQWACGAQLISGSSNSLLPHSGAQRDQVAAILTRFCQNVVK